MRAWEWRDGERVPVDAADWCIDCLNARGPNADRHCTATSNRWDRRFHRWASVPVGRWRSQGNWPLVMAKLFAVYVYDSGITHYALARREDLAAVMAPEDVTPDNWYHWRSVCGHEIIAHNTSDMPSVQEVNCKRCVAALEKTKRTVVELRERFGDGID